MRGRALASVVFGLLLLFACSDYEEAPSSPVLPDASTTPTNAPREASVETGSPDADLGPSLTLEPSTTPLVFDHAAAAVFITMPVVARHLAGPVMLTLSGLPEGVTTETTAAQVDNPTPSSVATFQLERSTPLVVGTYPLTVTATSDGLTATITLDLLVTYGPLVPGQADVSLNGGQPKIVATNTSLFALTPDGMIYALTGDNVLHRYDANGDADPTWTNPTLPPAVDFLPKHLTPDPSPGGGGVFVSGSISNGEKIYLLRFDATGHLDSAFGGGTGSRTIAANAGKQLGLSSIAASATHIVITARQSNVDDDAGILVSLPVFALTPEGDSEPGLALPAAATDGHSQGISDVAITSNELIVEAGAAADGQDQPSYGVFYSFDFTGGQAITSQAHFPLATNRQVGNVSIAEAAADRTVTIATDDVEAVMLARFGPTGALDPTFGQGGFATTQLQKDQTVTLFSAGHQSDGHYFATGVIYPPMINLGHLFITRFTSAGAQDAAFGGGIVGFPVDNPRSAQIVEVGSVLVVAARSDTNQLAVIHVVAQ